jgi:hypothetical protein
MDGDSAGRTLVPVDDERAAPQLRRGLATDRHGCRFVALRERCERQIQRSAAGGALGVLAIERARAAHVCTGRSQALGLGPNFSLGVPDRGAVVFTRDDPDRIELAQRGHQSIMVRRARPRQLGGPLLGHRVVDQLVEALVVDLERVLREYVAELFDDLSPSGVAGAQRPPDHFPSPVFESRRHPGL